MKIQNYKVKDNNYIDSSSIRHARKLLSDILNSQIISCIFVGNQVVDNFVSYTSNTRLGEDLILNSDKINITVKNCEYVKVSAYVDVQSNSTFGVLINKNDENIVRAFADLNAQLGQGTLTIQPVLVKVSNNDTIKIQMVGSPRVRQAAITVEKVE